MTSLVNKLHPLLILASVAYGQNDPANSDTTPGDSLGIPSGWTTAIFSRTQIASFPYRTIREMLPLVSSLSLVNDHAYVRGSRSYELGYRVNGMEVTNLFHNTPGFSFIPEAIEELTIETGAYGASFGSWNGGYVETRMREGGDTLGATLRIATDDLAAPGRRFLGTSSYGFKNFVGTVGGPLGDVGHFFLAGELLAMRNRRPTFVEPFSFSGLTDDGRYHPVGTPLPGDVIIKRNHVPGFSHKQTTLQGNVSGSISGFDIRLLGSYSSQQEPLTSTERSPLVESAGAGWSDSFTNYFRSKRVPIKAAEQWWLTLTAARPLTPDISFNGSISYFGQTDRTYDPDFGDDWLDYPDVLANANKGYTGFVGQYLGPRPYSTINGFFFADPNQPNDVYAKSTQRQWKVEGSVKMTLRNIGALSVGISHSAWTLRSFSISSISSWRYSLDTNGDGTDDRVFASEDERRYAFRNANFPVVIYGYDTHGNEITGGPDAPKTPTLTSFYVDNVHEEGSVRLRVGARYEIFNLKFPVVPYDSSTGSYGPAGVYRSYASRYLIDESRLSQTAPVALFLPRIRLEFRGENSDVFFSIGSYADLPPLSRLYFSSLDLNYLMPAQRQGYWTGGSLAGLKVEPEQSTHAEAGFRTTLSAKSIIGIRAYHKRMTKQIQLGYVHDGADFPYVTLVNDGEGVAKGIEFSLDSKPTASTQLSLAYAYSSAKGLSSHPTSNMHDVRFPDIAIPKELVPLEYENRHRIVGLLTFTSGTQGSDLLDDWNVTAIVTATSGHPYTGFDGPFPSAWATVWDAGSSILKGYAYRPPQRAYNADNTPWTINVDVRISKSFHISGLVVTGYVDVFNLFDRKNILNVYPFTGSTTADGWLHSSASDQLESIPRYTEFYNAINRENGWGYMSITDNTLYGQPRQIRMGFEVTM
ncbi:MAG: TonB-dependent receptor [Bacteroidota bacterium]